MNVDLKDIKVAAIDYETDYSKDYGIEECGVYGYLHDPRFNPYLMSVWSDTVQWVGHPKDFDWTLLADVDAYVAHNSGYDRQVLTRCVELGLAPAYADKKPWYCTANLSVFLGAGRSLKDASLNLLGVEVDKTMRHYMKGRTWADAVAAGKDKELMQYALDDSKNCYNIWQAHNQKWPEEERITAEITFQQTLRGVTVDTALLDEALPKVINAKLEALKNIPWAGSKDDEGVEIKPLSALAFKAWCKSEGIEVPTTTEAKSPEFKDWQDRHPDVLVPKYMQTYRSANALALKAQTIRKQTRPDGRWPFAMLYYGATTGRWSAGYEDDRNDSGGANIQNLIKEEMYGLNLRKALIAPKGKKFVVSDYSQIEPRCLAWLCNDQTFMQALNKGVPLYEAHARAQGSWAGEKSLKKSDPLLYLQKKAEVLALGYGAGWKKFIFMCGMYGASDCLKSEIQSADQARFVRYLHKTQQTEALTEIKTDEDWRDAVNAWKIVTNFRASKPEITSLWKQLERDCRRAAGTTYKIELPSGRVLPYFDVKTIGGLTVRKGMNAAPVKMWGAGFVENATQAMARDVMRDAIIRLESAGITTLFTVHDEVICEVDADFPKEEISRLMCIIPEWAPGLPIAVEQDETDYYKK